MLSACSKGVVASGADPSVIDVIATAGRRCGDGFLVIESPDADAQGVGSTVTTAGTVLRHANASSRRIRHRLPVAR